LCRAQIHLHAGLPSNVTDMCKNYRRGDQLSGGGTI
jgi:hypothetical protein